MARKGSYVVTARIVGAGSRDSVEAVLANGHRLLAHTDQNCGIGVKDLLPDEEIVVVVSTHDLSKGRIVSRINQIG
jgi:translation initiation factor IF-1